MIQLVASGKLSTIPVLSFFTGGGFLDMGFEKAGYSIVWTNEMHPGFVQFYEHGITAWRRDRGCAKPEAKISSPAQLSDLGGPASILKSVFPGGKHELFGIIGGPPCQDFSIAGLRAGFEGNRGSLTHEYCRHILEMHPAFFVMENVTGLLQKNHRATFDKLRESMGAAYLTDFAKLNALDYGVPQSRERLFFIGLRRDLVTKELTDDQRKLAPANNWAGWTTEQHPTHRGKRKSCKWATIELPGAVPEVPTCETVKALSINNCLVPTEEEASTHNARDRFKLNSQKAISTPEGMVGNRCFKRLHRYRFSPTACYGNNEVHLHPWLPQRLSVREVLRIQGVDESYILPEGPSLTTKFKMIGNGVPVPMALGVATTMRRLLDEYCGLKL
ncbi:DNA cytosine methyltransferase [Hymenobacter nivis]|uniref:DNA (cytosine-5-)-methyltransferase n=1 Tax=Hymenobacter nivis TaxID=1850093 RepID=A0A2Z3GIR5_9BACT|nr:DNA cytosine methyltransferase [Hymenobacter nivis]AWM32111.1 DNA (cytosine-5-)-methyltransferase [Hymenobacter nivis]